MNRIILLKSKVKEYEALYYQHRDLMNTAKTKLEWTKDQLEREEADMICDFCKKPIKQGESYIVVGPSIYCSRDCKSSGDIKEMESLEMLEADRQSGKL